MIYFHIGGIINIFLAVASARNVQIAHMANRALKKLSNATDVPKVVSFSFANLTHFSPSRRSGLSNPHSARKVAITSLY